MSPYYWTIALTALLSFFAEHYSLRQENTLGPLTNESIPTKLLLAMVTMVLIFVAGCRYYVGTDFGAYYKGLTLYGDRLEEAIRTFDEPGLPLLANVVRWFTDDGAYLVFSCSFFTIGLFLLTIYRTEKSYFMATLLFVLVGIWDGTFNGVRQYFAAAILFAGHRYIYEKKLWQYLIVVFLAACFHVSAVVMAALYFLLRNRITPRNVILLALGTIIVSANYDTVFSFIGLLKDSDTAGTTEYAQRSVNILRILVAVAPAVLCVVIHFGKELDKEQTFYFNALIIHASAMLLSSNSAYLARIGIYTSPFLTVAIPKLVRFDNKRLETLARVVIVVLYAVYWYIGISGSSTLREFHWIWER